jgi:hypothetical protein
MVVPVLASDGSTYERAAIEDWLHHGSADTAAAGGAAAVARCNCEKAWQTPIPFPHPACLKLPHTSRPPLCLQAAAPQPSLRLCFASQ